MSTDLDQPEVPRTCPDEVELAAFLDGALPEALSEQIAAHIETCESCETALDALHPRGGDFAEAVRQRIGEPQAAADEGLDEFERRVREVGLTIKDQAVPPAAVALEKTPPRLGAYRLLSHIGKGGMGQVFLAEHVHLKRTVALKILPPDRAGDPALLRRFYREMEAIGRLEHPNVVRARDAGEADGYHYLVMDYVPGIDLRGLLVASGPWTVADACEAMRQTAVGLEYIRQNGLVHRDIKPGNLIVTRHGRVKILDLGLARLRRPDSEASQLTGSDSGLGTYDYMAPEQVRRAASVDIRADLYSLGCTLYALLAGRPPFNDRSLYEKLFAHCHDPVPPLAEIRPDVPEAVIAILDSLLAKSPADRFENPARLAEALAPLCEGQRLSELAMRYVAVDAPADVTETADSLSTSVHEDTARKMTRNASAAGRQSVPRTSSRSVRFVWGLVVSCLVLVGISAAVFGPELAWRWLSDAGTAPPSVPAPTPAELQPPPRPNLDNVPLNRWVRLLEHEPREVFWPQDGLSKWFYDPQQEQVSLSSSHVGLLELGEVQRDSYRIQIPLHQAGWSGGIGVFFGLQQAMVEGSPCIVFQFLMINCVRRDGANVEYRMVRGIEQVFVNEQGERRFESRMFNSAVIPLPAEEQLIDLWIENATLKQVLLNGEELPRLLIVMGGNTLSDSDFRGRFGVIAQAASATVGQARFMATGTLRSGPVVVFPETSP
jgi:eukaryotic-like serine/threonine-protein kinase